MKINLNKLFKFPAINLLLKEKIVKKEKIITKYNRNSSPNESLRAGLPGKGRHPKPVFSIAFLALAPLNIRRLYSRFKKLVLLICLTGLVLSQISFAQGAGRGLTFDNTSTEYVVIGDDASLNLTTTFTVEAWVKTTSITSDKQALYCRKKVSGSKGYCFGIFNAEVVVGIDGNDFLSTGAGLTTNTWSHLAGTFDNDSIRYYVNGVKISAIHPNKGPTSANTIAPTLGRTLGIDYFGGTIDEVRVWSDVRTLDEIRDNMCKKLVGTETGLVGYWRLDEGSGYTTADASGSGNTGTLGTAVEGDDAEPGWVWSGAALGDASSNDYTGSVPSDFSASITHTNGDDITATGDGGTVTGIQVYRVDATSMRTDATKPGAVWNMDSERYWGVFCVGTSPTYTVTYNYDGHPSITTESDLGLAYRGDHSVNAWTDLDATLDQGANTLTKTGQSGTEYALGSPSGDNSLPVELSGFIAVSEMGAVILRWTTESEIENLGF
ncbi:MAG: LamG domain-containing protein, partial [Desulfobacteraceae bacterium]|nr:LamG domain-containing protein [Desulfobacteraceae bacterium]